MGEATEHEGIYYQTPPGVYESLGRSSRLAWAANERFLRAQLEAGVERLDFVGDIGSTLKEAGRSFRAREIRFLLEHAGTADEAGEYGYKLVNNSWIKSPSP